MWKKMQRVPNKFNEMDEAERKKHIKRIYDWQRFEWKRKGRDDKPTIQDAEAQFASLASEEWWANDRFQASVEYEGDWAHISLKRHDRDTYIDWQEKQWAKNDILGKEWEAVELFPAESRERNTANTYHLWGNKTIPLGFPKGVRVRDMTTNFATQDDDD
jgi:hypothetical protein